jgi:hypothetical protein
VVRARNIKIKILLLTKFRRYKMMENKLEKIKDGIYIPNIEACWLYKASVETGNYEIEEEYLDKLLKGKIDYSFELIENRELLDKINIEEKDGKLYTLDIVNVRYNKKYVKVEDKTVIEEKTTKELRDWTYINGFKFGGKVLKNWKRSGGKAREGENLFLIDNIKDKCLEWARMELKFEGEQDIAGIRAYESLPLSSIIGTVDIDPSRIYIVDDYVSEFPWDMSETWLENGELKTETKQVIEKNSIWDGEGLLSDKVFQDNEILNGHAVGLLRNRYMKCAAFCCYIEKFYRKYCEDNGFDYETYEISNKYNKIKVKDILLITTPLAIKLYKYNEEVIKETAYKGENAWLEYWKNNCGTTFGICKIDKPSHNCIKDAEGNVITYRNVLSYQMVNTIPFSSPEELKALLEPNLEYIDKLKNDIKFFLKEVKQFAEKSEDIINEEYANEDDNSIEIGLNIDVTGAFTKMVNDNPDFAKTQVFKDYRRNFITAYINELRKGKIMVEGADYAIACGNPIELLKETVGEFNETSELKGNELYCSRFVDGEDVIGFRNPSVNVGNIGVQKNKFVQDIEEYMKCSPTIVFLNSINFPILSTYSGEDFDIDCNLLTNHPTIIKACKNIDNKITPIPHNGIKNTGSKKQELTPQNMSNTDHIIAKNYIGQVINTSQEINSLYNHNVYNKFETVETLKEIYKLSSRCSSISNCEIDKAKKQFEDLNVPAELSKIKEELRLVDDESIETIDKDIATKKDGLKKLEVKIREHRKERRKPILKEIRGLKKQITADGDNASLENEIVKLEAEIISISMERQDEITKAKKEIKNKYNYRQTFDNRRVKPYFFKFIGDNDAKKQRKATNKKHHRELDRLTKEEYCKLQAINIEELDLQDKELVKLLKANEAIQKEWEDKIYDKEIDTPMNWLELEIDKITNSKRVGTIQVIKLVKKNKHKADKIAVDDIVKNIKTLDDKIKGYKLDDELKSKDKLGKIRVAKKEVAEYIKYMNLTKANLYGVIKGCLNSVDKNGKVDKKTGIESIALDVLFQTYGTGLLDMFA